MGYWIGLSIFLTSVQYAVHSDAFSTILVSFATLKKNTESNFFNLYVLLRDGRNFEIKQYITYSFNLLVDGVTLILYSSKYRFSCFLYCKI